MSPSEAYGTVEWLEGMRLALVAGWMLLFSILVYDNIEWLIAKLTRKAPSKKRAYELCKLHARPLDQCPPGSHGDGDASDAG